jgi:hypothetical protein
MTVFRTVEVALAFVAQNFQAKGKLYSSLKVYLGPAHIIPGIFFVHDLTSPSFG